MEICNRILRIKTDTKIRMNTKNNLKIAKRQVHLDFHTSEHFPDIGKRFSKEQFQQALKAARLDGINIFAKCNQLELLPNQGG